MTEARIQREIMLAASAAGMTIWRNNVGKAWQGQRIDLVDSWVSRADGFGFHVERGIILQSHRIVEFGLCPGSSDLIGLRTVEILPEHVGKTIAQFVAVEVKTAKGRTTARQKKFLDFVTRSGGFARVARNIDDLTEDES